MELFDRIHRPKVIFVKKTFIFIYFNRFLDRFLKKFVNQLYLFFFSILNSNLFSDLIYYERFERYFNFTEPQSKFIESSNTLQKKNKKYGLFLGALHDGMKKNEYSIVGQVLHFAHLIKPYKI